LVTERHAVLNANVDREGAFPVFRRRSTPNELIVLEPRLKAESSPELTRKLIRPARLEHEAPARAMYLPFLDGGGRLLIVIHHIAADAHSLNIILRDLSTAYRRRPFASTAISEVDTEQTNQPEQALLPLVSTTLPVPGSYDETSSQTLVTLEQGILSEVWQFARKQGATRFHVFLAAWLTTLTRLIEDSDFSAVVNLSARLTGDLTDEVGAFLVQQAFDLHVKQDTAFMDVVVAVTSQHESFVRQFRESVGGVAFGDPSLHMFNFVDRTIALVAAEKMGAELEDVFVGGVRFPVVFTVETLPHSTRLKINVDGAGFDEFYARALGDLFASTLSDLLAQPYQPLATALQATCGTSVWRPKKPHPSGERQRSIWETFQRAASRYPLRVAVATSRSRTTYSELQARARILATRLRTVLGPENRLVILDVEREKFPECFLGARAAGATPLVVDKDWPTGRKRAVADRFGAAVIVSDNTNGSLWSGHAIVRPADGTVRPENPSRAFSALQSSAYIVLTSGTTSDPAGVVVEDAHILSYLAGLKERLPTQASQTWAAVSTFAADLSYTAVFAALLDGGTLVIATADEARDVHALNGLMGKHDVQWLKITPSHCRVLLEQSEAALATENVLFGGEPLSVDLVRLLKSRGLRGEVYNHYGPCETTIGVTAGPVCKEESQRPAIGSPLGHVAVAFADRFGSLLPAGIPGSLVIGGPTVAMGYVSEDDRRRGGFRTIDETRVFVTQDLGRFRADGQIALLGRKGDHFKISGYRVNPEEVRAELQRDPAVADAAVMPVGDRSKGDVRLGCVLAPASVDPKAVRASLASRLPSHMIPTIVVTNSQLPVLPTGKLDRRRILALLNGTAGEKASSDLVSVIRSIWSDILGHSDFGNRDKFLEVGGTSVLLLQLFARLRDFGSGHLTIVDLFRKSTVEELAEFLKDK